MLVLALGSCEPDQKSDAPLEECGVIRDGTQEDGNRSCVGVRFPEKGSGFCLPGASLDGVKCCFRSYRSDVREELDEVDIQLFDRVQETVWRKPGSDDVLCTLVFVEITKPLAE